MDLQSRDHRISELEEVIFQAGGTMNMVCRSAVKAFSRFEFPRRGTDHQEYARYIEQAVGDLRSQLTIHEKKFQGGEKQMRRLKDAQPAT